MTCSFSELSAALSDLVMRNRASVVAIQGRRVAATGVHWQAGLIVTSSCALRQTERLSLVLPDGERVCTTVLGRDAATDVAILALPAGLDLPVVSLGDSRSLAPGQLVIAVGWSAQQGPFSELGMVSQVGGGWQHPAGGYIAQYIQVNLTLPPGSAGCPLINAQGDVVGFNGVGPRRRMLTIPAATVNPTLQQLQQRGKISQGYLGLSLQTVPLPDTLKRQHGLRISTAVMVTHVEPCRAADQAGVRLGDVILAANDEATESVPQIQALIGPQQLGQPLMLCLLRADQLLRITVTVDERG